MPKKHEDMPRRERIEACLKKAGLNKKQLADRIGIDPRYMSTILTEKRNPKREKWEKMGEVLNVSSDYLQYGVEDADEQRLLRAYRELKSKNRNLAEKGISIIESLGEEKKKVSNDHLCDEDREAPWNRPYNRETERRAPPFKIKIPFR